jgi:dipeptidyl aminopeptidase/acylaminoacyl peptidase
MKAFLQRLLALLAFLSVGATLGRAELPPLIPRQVLFDNPIKTAPDLSPDGKRLAYLAPSDKGVSNVWVRTLGKPEAQMVTSDAHRGIYGFEWAADGRHILYRQDQNGDENWHCFSIDLDTKLVRDLTPFQGIRAQDLIVSDKRPNEIVVGLNIRDRRVFDLHRVNLETGALTLEAQNPGDVLSWTADEHGVIRACTAFGGEDAHTTIRVRDNANAPWRDLMKIPFGDCPFYGQVNGGTLIVGFAPGGNSLYIVNPMLGDKTCLSEIDLSAGTQIAEIASDEHSDVEYQVGAVLLKPMVITDPQTGRIDAVGFNHTRLHWKVTNPALADDFATLTKAKDANLQIIARTNHDKVWLVQYDRPDTSTEFCLYDRPNKALKPLFVDRPNLAPYKLASVEPIVIKSRDGYDLVCYLTAPPGIAKKKLPLILFPHGGPWWRDRWGYDPWAQQSANRGYAVLQPQYRGSTGFGKKFLNAGNRQFGDLAVMNDYLDVVKWAVDTGLADPDRIGVMGGSGGGYATLCCLTFHPEIWKCGVDLVGPSSLRTLLESIPSYWKPVKRRWVLRLGDVEHDSQWEQKVSPIYHAKNIRAPLLIGHGLNDPRVHIQEAERMAKAMRDQHLKVKLIVYPDEGHGFARPENNLDFFGRVEEFLAENLGGRKEPRRPVSGATAEER